MFISEVILKCRVGGGEMGVHTLAPKSSLSLSLSLSLSQLQQCIFMAEGSLFYVHSKQQERSYIIYKVSFRSYFLCNCVINML